MNFCPTCGVRLARGEVAPTPPLEPLPTATAGAPPFLLLLAAAAIPLGVILLIVIVQPSVLKQPELYFAYAVIEATAFLLLFRLFDLYEREPLSVLALMAVWGGTVAVAVGLIGEAALGKTLPRPLGAVFGTAITAPIVEESAKGAALLAAFLVSAWANRRFGLLKFDGLTDGLLYGAAVGLGFALVEDLLYFLNAVNNAANEAVQNALNNPHHAHHAPHVVESGLQIFLTRMSLLNLNMLVHPLAAGAFGAGLGLATWSRTRWGRFGFPILGLLVAMLTHAVWNGFDELVVVYRYGWHQTSTWYTTGRVDPTLQDRMQQTLTGADQVFHVIWFGLICLWAVTIALWLRHQRKVIVAELAEEVSSGTLSRAERERLVHVVERSRTDWKLMLAGRFEERRLLRRLNGELVDLAFFKRRSRGQPEAEAELELRRKRIAAIRRELAIAASEVWMAA